MSKVTIRPAAAGSCWLQVEARGFVFASFQDELLAKRFAQQLARLRGAEVQSGPATAKVRTGSGMYALGTGGLIIARAASRLP